MSTDTSLNQMQSLLSLLSTGIITVSNISLLVHELVLAVERTDAFRVKYPNLDVRTRAISDCLLLLADKTPEPLKAVLVQIIQDSVPQLISAIYSIYDDDQKASLNFLNSQHYLTVSSDKYTSELSPLGRRYSLHFGGVDTRDSVLLLSTAPVPDTVDLQKSGFMPPVLDQGRAGTCAAHAGANALHFCLKKELVQPDWPPCRLFLYYTTRVYIEHTAAADDTGCSIRDICKAIQKFHVCSETFMPYKDTNIALQPSALAVANANLHGQVKYCSVAQNLHALQATLSSGYPIICGIQVYESFEQEAVMSSGAVPLPDTASEKLYGGHAILLVGYNNEASEFTFMNSWSASVGREGFFTIPYSYLTDKRLAADFWVVKFFQ